MSDVFPNCLAESLSWVMLALDPLPTEEDDKADKEKSCLLVGMKSFAKNKEINLGLKNTHFTGKEEMNTDNVLMLLLFF